MKYLSIIGIVLLIAGALGLIYGGITYTSKKESVEFGPVEIQVSEKEHIPLPPILGGIAMAAGVGLILIARRKK